MSDISTKPISEFLGIGGKAKAAGSPEEAALNADVLIIMVQSASQVEDVLFDSGHAAERLAIGAVVILSSTVPPSFARKISIRLQNLGKQLCVVDAPVSGGVGKAADGLLTVGLSPYV
jgi:3-hydroxyisobutyrate dehydrogenase-like beta-hydroxyacid dehydrogenase